MKTFINEPILKKVVIVGPDIKAQGGMGSVLNAYSQFLSPFNYLTTNSRRGKIAGLFNFGISLLKLPVLRLRGKRVLHIHYAGLKSWFRKKLVLSVGKILGYKTIMHCHCDLPFLTKIEGLSDVKGTLRKANINVLLATQYEKFAKQELDLPTTAILNNTVCCLPKIESQRTETVTFLFLGVMEGAKGVFELIEAAKLLKEKGKKFRIIMAGSGKDETAVKSLVQQCGLKDYIELPGWIKGDDKFQKIAQSHIFVLPSHSEGMPMSIIETKYYGLPAIATKTGATTDIIAEGVDGFLVEIGDVAALADAMEKYIDNPGLIQSHSENSRQSAEKFMPSSVGRNLIELYKSLSD